jgi:formate dehydrogenase iron-sulfur subunit
MSSVSMASGLSIVSACDVARDSDPQSSVLKLLGWALADQQQLTAVDQFSQAHLRGELPDRTSMYRSLLPATPPGPGQQYAFEVDLDRCSGCKACVAACHTLNGLDDQETWRDVGLLVGGTSSLPVLQHVTTACHHCLEPACLIGCPVNAYEKDPVTGIVKHLDDQCIGCQYCTLACPYEAPKYHRGKGIVRKCDMCSSRLAVGEAPACVQACPHQAIAIRVVDQRQVIEDAETAPFLPATPDPQITLPTTVFKTRKTLPRNLLPADYFRVNPQHAHVPLVVMLVLTQLSVGAFIVGLILDALLDHQQAAALRPLHAASALAFGLLALGASTLHLGRPLYAFRAVLGLRHSWLSREIVALGIFAMLACAYAAAVYLTRQQVSSQVPWLRWLGGSVAIVGGVGIFCSAMIYIFTGRECWSFLRVVVRFTLTSALLGVALVWLSILTLTVLAPSQTLRHLIQAHGNQLCGALIFLAAAKLLFDAAIFRHLLARRMTPLKRSSLLMLGDLGSVTLARYAAGLLGGIVLPLILTQAIDADPTPGGLVRFVVLTSMMFVAALAGELMERYLFFAACAAPRMPGGMV